MTAVMMVLKFIIDIKCKSVQNETIMKIIKINTLQTLMTENIILLME